MKKVCCIVRTQMALFDRRDPEKHCRCSVKPPRAHFHLPHAYVVQLVSEGKAEWVGMGERCAVNKLAAPVEWHKVAGIAGTGNARLAAMQLLRGGEQRFPYMLQAGLVSPR
jgi:hypothetical protein